MLRHDQIMEPVSIYAVTSGKGGVGKTNIVLNLAIALTEAGRRVLILDADLGLGNLDVLLGLSPNYSLADVLLKRCSMKDAIVKGPNDIKILPADSGSDDFTKLSTDEMIYTFSLFQKLNQEADTILIDTASGISSNVLFFSSFAHQVLLIATPEPTSITDAYATMKVLNRKNGEQNFNLMINMVDSEKQGLEVYETLRKAAEHFLNIDPGYIGFIRKDGNVKRAVYKQEPVMILHPNSQACKNIRILAQRLLEEEKKQISNPERAANKNGSRLSLHH